MANLAPGMGGAKVPRTPPMGPTAAAALAEQQREEVPMSPEPEERESFDAENHPLAGVPNVEAGKGVRCFLFFSKCVFPCFPCVAFRWCGEEWNMG